MIYDEFINDKIFFMRRYPNSKAISLFSYNSILSDMIYWERITIWRKVNSREIKSNSLTTTSTPKLRKIMRTENFISRNKV